MGTLMERAMAEWASLPPDEQEAAAAWFLEELESERRWDSLLAESREQLRSMAREARREHERGETKPLDADTL